MGVGRDAESPLYNGQHDTSGRKCLRIAPFVGLCKRYSLVFPLRIGGRQAGGHCGPSGSLPVTDVLLLL